MLKAVFIRSTLLFFAFFTIVSCKEKKAMVEMVPDVNVVSAAQRTLPVYSEFIGQTYGQSDIEIQPRVDGWITGMHFKEGDRVTQGQLLYTIDDIQLKNRVASAQAGVAEAEVMVQK